MQAWLALTKLSTDSVLDFLLVHAVLAASHCNTHRMEDNSGYLFSCLNTLLIRITLKIYPSCILASYTVARQFSVGDEISTGRVFTQQVSLHCINGCPRSGTNGGLWGYSYEWTR